MSLIDKSDLKYNYSWSSKASANPRTDSTSDRGTRSNMFSSQEGESVLAFINDYAKKHSIVDKEEALRIEGLLHEKLEKKEMTEDEVRRWLDIHMKRE